MTPSRARHWTYADYLRLPDDGPRYEILEGDRVEAPAPFTRHQFVSRNLLVALATFAQRHDKGEVLDAPCDVILADDTVLQPDLLFVAKRRERIIKKRGIFGAPDLAIEILSRWSAKRDTGRKLDLYAKHGVREYWIVDPDEDRIEVFVLEGRELVKKAEHEAGRVRSLVAMPGFSAALAKVFARSVP